MKVIPLTKGVVCWVDDEDFEEMSQFNWYARRGHRGVFYASRQGPRPQRQMIHMHREIMKAGDSVEIDHREYTSRVVDNRRCNLRISHRNGQAANRRHRINATNPYKGVHSSGLRWFARATLKGKSVVSTGHESAISAAHAYDRLAVELFGEFAKTNF